VEFWNVWKRNMENQQGFAQVKRYIKKRKRYIKKLKMLIGLKIY